MPRYVLKDASASMPASVKAPYRKVAIIEMKEGFEDHKPSMISLRAKGVERIVWDSGPLHAKGVGCAWAVAYRAAHRAVERLNTSLAVQSFIATGDHAGLNKYVYELVQEERNKGE